MQALKHNHAHAYTPKPTHTPKKTHTHTDPNPCMHTHTHSYIYPNPCTHIPSTHTHTGHAYTYHDSCDVSLLRTRNTASNSTKRAWCTIGQYPIPRSRSKAGPPPPTHAADPTAPTDSTKHASPDQTQLWSQEGRRPALGQGSWSNSCASIGDHDSRSRA